MKFKKIEIIDIFLIIGLLGIVWFLIYYLPSRELYEMDVMKYYEAQFYEEDGIGKAYILACYEDMCREMLLYGENISREEAESFIQNCFEVTLSKYEELKNNDVIIMKVRGENKILRKYGLRFKNGIKKVTVTGIGKE